MWQNSSYNSPPFKCCMAMDLAGLTFFSHVIEFTNRLQQYQNLILSKSNIYISGKCHITIQIWECVDIESDTWIVHPGM